MGFTLFGKKRVEEEEGHDHSGEEVGESDNGTQKAILPISLMQSEPDIRTIGLYGEVEEKKVAEIIGALIQLAATAEVEEPINPENPEEGTQVVAEPIEFIS